MITKFILIALVLLFASCNQSINLKAITGSGFTTEKELYNKEVSNAIDLIIEQIKWN
jgi:hypothetical protein